MWCIPSQYQHNLIRQGSRITRNHPVCNVCAGADDSSSAQADFEGLSPDAAWGVLLQAVQQYDTRQHGCRLHLAAVQAALGRERRLKIPAALLAPFQVCLSSTHMVNRASTANKDPLIVSLNPT